MLLLLLALGACCADDDEAPFMPPSRRANPQPFQCVVDDEPNRHLLAPVSVQTDPETLLACPEIIADLALPADTRQRLLKLYEQRRNVVAGIVATIADRKLSELERALRLRATREDRQLPSANFHEQLSAELPVAAQARLEQLRRQFEGAIGAYAKPRRQELGISPAAWKQVQPKLAGWKDRVFSQVYAPSPLAAFWGPGELTDDQRREWKQLDHEILETLSPRQHEDWTKSLGKPLPIVGAAFRKAKARSGSSKDFRFIESSRNWESSRTRPLQQASFRRWLGLNAEQEIAHEELQQARDSIDRTLFEMFGLLSHDEVGRLKQAFDKAYYPYGDGHFDRQARALLTAKQVHQLEAVHLMVWSPLEMMGPPWMEQFQLTKEQQVTLGRAVTAANEKAHKSNFDADKDYPEHFRIVNEDSIAELPEPVQRRWRELTKLDPAPTAAEWGEFTQFFLFPKRPREPHKLAPKEPSKPGNAMP